MNSEQNESTSATASARRPGVRLTKSNKEVGQLTELVAIMLGQQKPKSNIKATIRRYFHEKRGREVGARTCEEYLRRARDYLRDLTGKSKEELFQDSVNFWLTTIQDPSANRKDRMYARERLDNLFGLEAPKIIRVRGEVATRQMTDEELLRVALGEGQTPGLEALPATPPSGETPPC